MSPWDDLLRRLDAAGPDEWEDEYARRAVDVTDEDVEMLMASGRPYAESFAIRFEIGPPGVPLAAALASADAARRAVIDEHADHPLVQDLRTRAMVPGSAAPEVDDLPAWFEDWARAIAGSAQPNLARLAGLVLSQTGASDSRLVLALILPVACAADLGVLASISGALGLPPIFDELASVASSLPETVAEALIAAASPRHIHVDQALVVLIQHVDLLEQLKTVPGGVVEHVLGVARTFADSARIARPRVEQLLAAVRRSAARFADGRLLLAEDVVRAAEAIEVPELTVGFLERAASPAELGDLERLLVVLALRHAVRGTVHEKIWGAPLSKLASDAIFDLRVPTLFELRLKLLDEIIAADHPLMSRANLFFQRGNTRRGLSPSNARETDLARAEFGESMRLSLEEGDPSRCAAATAAWVKTLAWIDTGDGQPNGISLREVNQAIDEALSLPLESMDQAALHQARAHLLSSRNPVEAAAAIEAALGLVPEDDPLWIELGAELVGLLGRAGRGDEAVRRGLALIERASCGTPRTELGMLHLALGEAMASMERFTEARQQLEAGLRLVRGRDEVNEALAHLHLAKLGLATKDNEMLEENLRFLQANRDDLDPVMRRDLHVLEAAVARASGRADDQRASLQQALSLASDETTRIRFRLEIACVDLATGEEADGLDQLIDQALGLSQNDDLDAVLTDLVYNHDVTLPKTTWDRVIEWAVLRERPSVAAKVHYRLGRHEDARATLRVALSGELEDRERLGCLHHLVTSLDPESRDERRKLCVEVERGLEEVHDEPHVRLDLAAALLTDAEGDTDVLWRARRHAERALERASDPRAREYGHRTLGHVVVELVRVSVPESSDAVAELAMWLLGELALPVQEATGLRLETAALLLLPGPIVHPRALGIARRLLDLATPEGVGMEGFAELLERLKWIERCVDSGVRALPVPATATRPLDGLPSWLIGLVHSKVTRVSPQDLETDVRWLVPALHSRPDVADRVLGTLLPLQPTLAKAARGELLDAIYAAVQSITGSGREVWPALQSAIDAVPAGQRHAKLTTVKSAIQRASLAARCGADGKAPATGRPRAQASAPAGGRVRARECFERGVALMQGVKLDPMGDDAARKIREAREWLAEAVRIARKGKIPELFDYIVSQGNAWKTEPEADVDHALRIYDLAAKLDTDLDHRAKLWKVEADALRARGRPDDIRRAEKLIERSLKVRHGWVRAETLLSAAQVALVHPDLDKVERAVRAAGHLMDAVRTHAQTAEQALPALLAQLAIWRNHRSDDPRPARLHEELKSVYPGRAAEIDSPVAVDTERHLEIASRLMGHPAAKAFLNVRTRLMPTSERGVDPLGLLDRIGPSAKAAIEEQAERDSLLGRADQCEAELARLATSREDPARPGVLAAHLWLVAHLARLGRRTSEAVRAATKAALDALEGLDDTIVRSTLLREIALVWTPDDHSGDVVRDFGLAAELLRQCVKLEGGEERATDDTLCFLARALRYSPVGNQHANLRESRRLYRKCLERARLSGGADLIARVSHNLSDVESQMGEGSRLDRLRRGTAALREAADGARSPHEKAEYTASLAWELTQLAYPLGGAEGERQLEHALATFDEVDISLLGQHARRNLEGNRAVCEAALAGLRRGRDAEIEVWRRHLNTIDAAAPPTSLATARHNLASVLMFGPVVTPVQMAEGLSLSKDAAEVRIVEANARHHWETALNAGRALVEALLTGRFHLLPMEPREAAEEARNWLRAAVGAARLLGSGEELAHAGFALCELGLGLASATSLMVQTEEAWAVVREAAPYLLQHAESRDREARVALAVAAGLASRLAADGLVVTPGLAFVLHGEKAEFVARWMLRGQEPSRRPLRARLSRPRAVPAALWESWLSVLDERDEGRLIEVLDRIRVLAPEFPSDSSANEPTWSWLLAQPGSVAVALAPAEPVSLALVMQVDAEGRRNTWVLGLEIPPAPLSMSDLPALMRGASARDSFAVLAAWLREHAVEPIVRFLGARPSAVLWSPGPGLRLVAPGAIWRGVPVATTAALSLPDLQESPGRRRSTLTVLADPGALPANGSLDLRGHGEPALQRISEAAASLGRVTLLGSVGEQFGRSLFRQRPEKVRDTPASARDLLNEVAEHDVIVLIAHGEVETVENAAVLCVDKAGNLDRLDVAMLAREPDRFAGAMVVLLSCEGGRVGDSLVEPGGLAGTLVSAGARCVVAPLWPVRLDVAAQVGVAVLEGVARGEEPWAVLAKLQAEGSQSSPTLGGPPPAPSERKADLDLQRLAFVTWVG